MSPSPPTRANCGAGAGRALSLPVLGAPRIRESGASRWRWAVLIAVNALMAVHIVQWLIHGVTISPVEPSESMYTIELGKVNAGFVFFTLALLSTILFGRFFCGWGCHVVALQDFCAWLMKKCGVQPRPFRTRLLPLWTLLLALYMFVWPAFKRHALYPAMARLEIEKPVWLADVAPFNGFHAEFVVTNYWATFAPWYIAIPFLLVCGFATVYFMGSKAFCTFGCPYGGFFAPLDRVSLGKIVVSDACEGCGHCTAVCTSNVRVHQEVRDFGMVVDPGCMKCLDCVSVCPNHALSFKFAAPSVLARPRTGEARAGHSRRPPGDLSRTEEVVLFVVGIAFFLAFRQMLQVVPLLMAAGMAGLGAFGVWKIKQLLVEPSVRLQSLQLKIKGRLTAWGVAFATLGVVYTSAAAWSGAVRYLAWRADLIDLSIHTPYDRVFSPGYVPDPADAARANTALRYWQISDGMAHGGIGWTKPAAAQVRRAWMSSAAGDFENAERMMQRALLQERPGLSLVEDYFRLLVFRGASAEQVGAAFDRLLERYPDDSPVRLMYARFLVNTGQMDRGKAQCAAVLNAADPGSPQPALQAAEMLMDLGSPQDTLKALRSLRGAKTPDPALVAAVLSRGLYLSGSLPEAIKEMEWAAEKNPANVSFWGGLAELYTEAGRLEDAERARRRAGEQSGAPSPSPAPPGR